MNLKRSSSVMSKSFRAVVALAMLSLTTSLIAQGPPAGSPQGPPGGGPQGPPPAPLVLHQLTPAVYWVEGAGGNGGVVIGDKGVIVVDAKVSVASGTELLADIAKLTPKPVTAVIITHSDTDHIGGLAAFPAGVKIIAQENAKKEMEAALASGQSRVPADRLPNQLVTNRESVTLDGVKVELLHWAPAHTGGDLVVYLPAEKIVFTGDIFVFDQPRALVHREKAGTSEGWITTAKGIVALNADRFVVGHGDVKTKAELEERLNLVIAEKEQIKKLVAEGKTLAEVEAAVGDPPPGQSAPPPGRPRFPPFAEVVYQELTEKK